MKKLFYFIATAAVVAVACTKEAVINQEETTPAAGEKVTLFATMPEFTDANTKAAISDAGVFSWTVGDVINVVFEKSGVGYLYREFTCSNASEGEFTYEGTIPEGYRTVHAYYPASYTGTASNQTFASPKLAAKGFQMQATYTDGKLKFVHDNAMMKVTVNNVPSFAETLKVGTVEITLNLNETGNVTAYVPMAPTDAEEQLTIQVTEGSNTIISKTSSGSVKIDRAALYPLPTLTIGPVLLVKNNVLDEKGNNAWNEIDNANGKINLHTYISGSQDFTSYSNNNFKEISISGNDYVYYVYPATDKNNNSLSGQTVHVNIRCLGYDYPKLEADIQLANFMEYSFGYAQGLKKSTDKFIYAMYDGSETARCKVYVEDNGTAVFGAWWDTNPTQTTVMYKDNGTEKRFLNIYNITNCSTSATFEPLENGEKYYMYNWSWKDKVSFSEAGGIKDYYLIFKWESPNHHVYNETFNYLVGLVY